MNKLILWSCAILGFVVAMATPAYAQPTQSINCAAVDISSMTVEQIQNVKEFCQNQTRSDDITPEKVKEWAGLGKEFSTAVVDIARELGVTANEFLFTPVGFMIAFYFMWDMVGGILIGIPLLIALWILYFKIGMYITTAKVEYTYVPMFWGMFSVKKISSRTIYNGEATGLWYSIGLMGAIIPSATIIFALIF